MREKPCALTLFDMCQAGLSGHISSGGALVAKVAMAHSNSNIDVGELVANIVNHPDFRQTLTNILQSSSSLNTASSESNPLATASGSLGARPITGRTSENISSSAATTSSRQDIRRQDENLAAEGEALFSRGGNGNNFSFNCGTVTGREEDSSSRQNNRRQYQSPAAEMAALFNRGGSSSSHSFNRDVNYARRARGRQRPSSSRHTPSPIRRSSIFRTREVILLPTASENEVVRGQRKNLLMSEGFVRSELEINKNWNEKEVIEFFESCFSDKLEPIQKVDGRNRITIMLGVGRNLQTPCLQPDQLLNGSRISRLFAQKNIWLKPVENIQDIDQCLITDMLPDLDGFSEEDRSGNENFSNQQSIATSSSQGTVLSDDVARLQEILPNTYRNDIVNALSNTVTASDAVALLIPDENDSSSNDGLFKNYIETVETPSLDVNGIIDAYRQSNLLDTVELLTISREHLWREGLLFYKASLGNKEKLFKKLSLQFIGEEGIDGGALTNEFFTLLFSEIKSQLFEPVNSKTWLFVPKRTGGNLQIFKIVGMIVAHSILQGGPLFNHFPSWIVDIMVNDLSGDISVDQIPVTAATGCLLNFIRSLEACKRDEDIQLLFTDADGPAFEQLISSSDWDPVETTTMKNRNILINMLVYEETVMRRGRKMKAMCEGLLFMNFGKYLNENHCRLLFLGLESKVTTNKLKSSFIWKETADSAQEDAKQWFLEFVDGASEAYLKKILKFSTGFEDINNLRGNEITIDFLQDEVFLKASACSRIIFLPLGCSDRNMFIHLLQQALEFECEGYGDF